MSDLGQQMVKRLRAAVVARDSASLAVASVQARHDALTAELETLESAVETTHAAFKSAAGANAVGEVDATVVASARVNYRTASAALDEAVIAASGVGERVVAAEATLHAAENTRLELISAYALLLASRTESEIERRAAELGGLIGRHRALALLASESASAAAGQHIEPIDCSSPSTPLSRHVGELLAAPAPRISADDLLADASAK